jgi:hypothetical protein
MRVGNQKRDIERGISKFPFQSQPKGADSAACVKDDDLVVRTQFNTGSVTAIVNGAWTWGGD